MGRNLKRGAQSVNDWNLGSREEANRRQERDHWPFTTGFTWVWAFKLVCMCPLCYTSLKLYPFSNGCTVSVLWLLESWNRSLNSFKTVALMVFACSSMWNFWANAGQDWPYRKKTSSHHCLQQTQGLWNRETKQCEAGNGKMAWDKVQNFLVMFTGWYHTR